MGLLLYLAGPMRGFPQYNFKAFELAEQKLLEAGHRVVNPHSMDLQAAGLQQWPDDLNWDTMPNDLLGKSDAQILIQDLEAIASCDAVAFVEGWHRSKGCIAEYAFANFLGIQATSYYHFLQGE